MARTRRAPRRRAAFSALPTVTMTLAPSAAAIWIAVVPMPLAAAMHEQPFAWLEAAALEYVVPDGEHGLGQRGCFDQREAVRHGQGGGFRRDGEFGIAAAIDQRADEIAVLEARRHRVPRANDLPATSSPRRSEAPLGGG